MDKLALLPRLLSVYDELLATFAGQGVESFRISANGVEDETQIHTHMCYWEFNDIIASIADMGADVITIES